MVNMQEFTDVEFQGVLDETSEVITVGMLPIDECLAVLSKLGNGASKAHAQIVADLGLLDIEETPVEAFTLTPTSLNEDVLMLGLVGGIVKAIAAIAKAIFAIIAGIIRAITFPFRWALGMTGSDSGGGGGGGGGGGSSSPVISGMESKANKLKSRAEELTKRLEKETDVDPTKVDFNLESYLLNIASEGMDETGMGSMLNYIGTMQKAENSIPPGIYSALVNNNPVLKSLGVMPGTGDKADPDGGIWWTRYHLINLTMMQDELTDTIAHRLFEGHEKQYFSDFEGKLNERVMTGWRGTREQLNEMYFRIVGINTSNPTTEPMGYDTGLVILTRYHKFVQYCNSPIANKIPILSRVVEHIGDVPMSAMGTGSSILESAFETFKADPHWERVKAEMDNLTYPDLTGKTKNDAANLDLIRNLQDSNFRESINTIWAALDQHVYKAGNSQTIGSDSPPSQLADIETMLSSSTIHGDKRPLGVNYSQMAYKLRVEYGIEDKRIGKEFNKALPTGMIGEPADTVKSAYLIRTLENLVKEAMGRGWKREADGYKGLVTLLKDNINSQAKVVKFAALIQTMFSALVSAAWYGLNEWMLDVQEAYISLISYSLVHHASPTRIIKDVESIISRKLTDAERTLIVEDIADCTPGDIKPPTAALTIIFNSKETRDENIQMAGRIIKFAQDYTDRVRSGHRVRNKIISRYLGANRSTQFFKSSDTTVGDLYKILNREPLGELESRRRPSKIKSIKYMRINPNWTKPPRISKDLAAWVKRPGHTKFPFLGDEETTNMVRATYAREHRIARLRYAIMLQAAELEKDPNKDHPHFKHAEMELKGMREDLKDLLRNGERGIKHSQYK